MSTVPATHRVVIRHRDGRPYSTFASHDAADAHRFLIAVLAANPRLVGEVAPIVYAKPMPDGLQAVA